MTLLANGQNLPPEGWAFLSAICVALIGVLGAQLKARSDVKRVKTLSERTKSAADKAAESASAAQANTVNISNGFASRVLGRLDSIYREQQAQGAALREHLQWHLERKDKDK